MKYFILNIAILLFSMHIRGQQPAPVVRYCGFNINTNDIEIRWDPSPAADAAYYQVWYYYPPVDGFSSGWVQISANIPVSADRFASIDPNTMLQATPLEEPVIIGIQTFNSGGLSLNSLNENDFDSTIFITAQYDSCLASLNLQWSRYSFKRQAQPGTDEYRIYISNDNGVSYTAYASVPYGTNSYQINDLDENQNYVVYIAAVSQNHAGEEANSNLAFINTDMAILPRYMHANYATFADNNTLISFSLDPASETNKYNILRSDASNGVFDSITRINTVQKEILYTDNIDFSSGPYYYKIEVINNCNINIRESENISSTTLLKQQGEALTPELSWNSYLSWIDGVSHYGIERKFGNTDFTEIATTSDTIFTDTELSTLVENNYTTDVCYQVKVYEENGTNQNLSNPVCVELPPNIRFEYDAFMPGSGTSNDSFGPTIDFIPAEYTFKILDRKGMVVFKSTDPENTRWDGYFNGQLAEQGAYFCVLQYRVGSGKRQTVHGVVSVVY